MQPKDFLKAEILPDYVVKTLIKGKCPGLMPVRNADDRLIFDETDLISVSEYLAEDRLRLMSGITKLIALMEQICIAAIRCSRWFIEENMVVPSEKTVYFDLKRHRAVLLPSVGGETFYEGLIGLLETAAVRYPWTCADLILKDLKNSLSGADVKTLRFYFENIRKELEGS